MTTASGATAAVLLGLAAAAIWIAALMPQFFPVWTGSGDALAIIAEHTGLWRLNASLFAASAILSLAGCAALLVGALTHPLTVAALALMTVATGLWVADCALRATAMVEVARDRTPEGEHWLALARSWAGGGWMAAAIALILAFAAIGAVILATGTVALWAGWVTLASAAFSLGLLLITRDMPPIVVYLPVLPLAVAAAVAAARA